MNVEIDAKTKEEIMGIIEGCLREKVQYTSDMNEIIKNSVYEWLSMGANTDIGIKEVIQEGIKEGAVQWLFDTEPSENKIKDLVRTGIRDGIVEYLKEIDYQPNER